MYQLHTKYVSLFTPYFLSVWSVCPSGFLYLGGKCYQYFKSTNNWAAADAHCHSLGGFLAEPKSLEEFIYIRGLALTHQATSHIWLGGRKKSDHQWTWVNSLDKITYLPWARDQPNDTGDCLHLSRQDHFGLDDHWCNMAQGAAVCQVAPLQQS